MRLEEGWLIHCLVQDVNGGVNLTAQSARMLAGGVHGSLHLQAAVQALPSRAMK